MKLDIIKMVWRYFDRVTSISQNGPVGDEYGCLGDVLAWARSVDPDSSRLALTCGAALR